MIDAEPTLDRYGRLARHLETLASPTRLELLHALRAPQALHEIRVTPSLSREGENEERPLSRQAVTRHLDQLEGAGLVQRVPSQAESSRGDAFVINHERLFAMVDEIRNLAKLRPVAPGAAFVAETVPRDESRAAKLPELPRLLVAYGRDDGIGYGLSGPNGSAWRIGRAPGCEVRLDYDPFVSSENAVIERVAGGFVVRDARSRNGTWINWSRLPPGAVRPLTAGDLLMVGRSLLVFQA